MHLAFIKNRLIITLGVETLINESLYKKSYIFMCQLIYMYLKYFVWIFPYLHVYRYICISSVYFLTTECSSLTVTLVITLRKFASLLFSILYFSNPFTLYHWIGTLLVFIGTIIFTEIPQKVQQMTAPKKATKKSKKTN